MNLAILSGAVVGKTRAVTVLEIATSRRPEGRHVLLTAAARTLSLTTVLRLSDTDAETVFAAIR
ncbi:hypothetical protein [Azospirillum halopraeferens]|uniref:hypothetical protein n=1 Tax=Azospirillum halopraeferens TaxID=34010 RepID=UPI00048EDE8A|nr:hypothetical protein [Azospirillum halopraeferens]